MSHEEIAPTLYGLLAEFDTPDALVTAAEKARLAGYRQMDAYSPIPIEELNEALGLRRTRLPKLVFIGGVLGAALTCFVGMWALNKLPQPYHPVFNVPAFARASTDRFFLCIEAADPA